MMGTRSGHQSRPRLNPDPRSVHPSAIPCARGTTFAPVAFPWISFPSPSHFEAGIGCNRGKPSQPLFPALPPSTIPPTRSFVPFVRPRSFIHPRLPCVPGVQPCSGGIPLHFLPISIAFCSRDRSLPWETLPAAVPGPSGLDHPTSRSFVLPVHSCSPVPVPSSSIPSDGIPLQLCHRYHRFVHNSPVSTIGIAPDRPPPPIGPSEGRNPVPGLISIYSCTLPK